MNIEYATAQKPSRQKNDDIAGYVQNTVWLMDGATQLSAPDHGLDAAWHVGRLDQSFRRLLAQEPDMALDVLARSAIQEVGQEFYARTGLSAKSLQDSRPLCTLILCRPDFTAGKLDYLLLCDSTLAVIGQDKETILTDSRIDQGKPLSKFYDLLRGGKGFASPEAVEEMKATYRKAFDRLNKPNEWFAVAQDSTMIDHAMTGTIPLTDKDHVILMSDGFTRAVDTLDMYPSFKALDDAISEKGIEKILEDIRATERSDPDGLKYPRSSVHDDATALRITF